MKQCENCERLELERVVLLQRLSWALMMLDDAEGAYRRAAAEVRDVLELEAAAG